MTWLTEFYIPTGLHLMLEEESEIRGRSQSYILEAAVTWFLDHPPEVRSAQAAVKPEIIQKKSGKIQGVNKQLRLPPALLEQMRAEADRLDGTRVGIAVLALGLFFALPSKARMIVIGIGPVVEWLEKWEEWKFIADAALAKMRAELKQLEEGGQ